MDTFSITVTYHGEPKLDLDDKVIDAIGFKYWQGSGYGFGERDLGFFFPIRELAEEARIKAQKIQGIRVSDVEAYNDSDEENWQ